MKNFKFTALLFTIVFLIVSNVFSLPEDLNDVYIRGIESSTDWTLTTVFKAEYEDDGHQTMSDSAYFYPTLTRGFFNYTWSRDYFDNQRDYLGNSGLKNYVYASTQSYGDSDNIDVDRVLKSEKQNEEEFLISHEDFYGAHDDSAASLGNSGSVWDDQERLAGQTVWRGDHNPGGYIIGVNGQDENDLDSNYVRAREYGPFFQNGGDSLHIWLYMRRTNANQNGDDEDDLISLHWHNKYGAIVETGSKAYQCEDFTTAYQWYEFVLANVNLKRETFKLALKWHGQDSVAVAYIKYADHEYLTCNPDSGRADYQQAVINEFADCVDELGPNNIYGWMVAEVYKYGFGTFNRMQEWLINTLPVVRRARNLDNDDLEIPPYLQDFVTGRSEIPLLNSLCPAYGREMIDDYLTETELGALVLDKYPIGWGADASDMDGLWDDYIDGVDHWDWLEYRGIRDAADEAKDQGIPLWAGVQCGGTLKPHWDDEGFDEYKKHYQGEVTPEMLKCQAYLNISFGARGLFYQYYTPHFGSYDGDWYANPGESTGLADTVFHGSITSGLLELRRNRADTSQTITTPEQMNTARADVGYFHCTPKWWAAREVNMWLNTVGWNISGDQDKLIWLDSEDAADQAGNEVDVIDEDENELATVKILHSFYGQQQNENWSQRHVQVGTFQYEDDGSFAFVLVNRRCDTDEQRELHMQLQFPEDFTGAMWELNDIPDGEGDYVFIDDTTRNSWEVTLDPGEAVFYMVEHWENRINLENDINVATTLDGHYFIDDSINVTTLGSLRIAAGTTIEFSDEGELVCWGPVYAIGNKDSIITFKSWRGERNDDAVTLKSSSEDSLVYCHFRDMGYGVNVVKGTSEKVYVDKSMFENCENEGLKISGGEATIYNCFFIENGTDGLYAYNCKVVIDSCYFSENTQNGAYLYSVSSGSKIFNSTASVNGREMGSSVDANIRIYNSSPKLKKNYISYGGNWGLYGANGSYPIMTFALENAANSMENNVDHETYWNSSYPSLSYGHNNFYTEDDTIIYIENTSLSTFNAKGNYWGGGAPNTNTLGESISYYGPGTFLYDDYDTSEQTRMRGQDRGIEYGKNGQDGYLVNEEELEALDNAARAALAAAMELEEERPRDAITAYRDIVDDYTQTFAAPIALERMFWMTRDYYRDQDHDRQVNIVHNYFEAVADTCQFHDVAWKAQRAALWALAAQHRYDEAIRGFEAIVNDPDNLADSVFAVIDIGTIQLEAREWARRNEDDEDRNDAVMAFGSMPELCPVDFPTHRKRTDELLAYLAANHGGSNRIPNIPREYYLDQNYPNPFNQTTRIRYGLPEDGNIRIRIYDVMGREVITLVDEAMKAGRYTSVWHGVNKHNIPVSSGVYFYRIQAGSGKFIKTNKMTLLK